MTNSINVGSNIQSDAAIHWASAVSFFENGQIHEAFAACQRVLALEPHNFDAVLLVGKVVNRLGQQAMAENLLRAALSIQPDSVDALSELGSVLTSQGKLEQALECLLKTHELEPTAKSNFNVATVLFDLGRMNEALQYCQKALSIAPDFLPALVRAGMIYFKRDDLHNAQDCLSKALLLAPDDVDALNILAWVKINLGLPDEALPYLKKVLAQNPANEFALARMQDANFYMQDHSSTKEAFYNAGLTDAAESLARDDLARDDSVENHNFLLKCYLVNKKHSALDYFQECRNWAKSHEHEDALPLASEFKNDRNPERRLRVGIVGDYFVGVIGAYTLDHFFRKYDRSKLEVYCYNFGPGEDYLRTALDRYRDISQLSGQDFFELVRDDAIDIMLDINGRIRTPNYFETLLRQPAPIQVNWYNLPCTVGVKAYNYAIADDYCVRDGEEGLFVEKVFKMPTGTICAWTMGEPPVPPPPPVVRNGYVTFGCFGDFFKVSEGVLATWAELLGRVPGSRLYLKSNNLRLQSERQRVSDFFRHRGVEPQRLMLEGMSSFAQMKKCYEWVDIALDTFPYSSGSTTINALFQGVPVIAIDGQDWRGRSTAAVLAGCKLEKFIAKDVAGYLDLACALAADRAQLVDLRASLGRRFSDSPQCQAEQFARNFESRLRMMWHDWLRQSN